MRLQYDSIVYETKGNKITIDEIQRVWAKLPSDQVVRFLQNKYGPQGLEIVTSTTKQKQGKEGDSAGDTQ